MTSHKACNKIQSHPIRIMLQCTGPEACVPPLTHHGLIQLAYTTWSAQMSKYLRRLLQPINQASKLPHRSMNEASDARWPESRIRRLKLQHQFRNLSALSVFISIPRVSVVLKGFRGSEPQRRRALETRISARFFPRIARSLVPLIRG